MNLPSHTGEHFLGGWFVDPGPSAVWTSLSYYWTATSCGASLPSVRKNTKAKCKTESQQQWHSLLIQVEVMYLRLVALSDIFHRDLWTFGTKWVFVPLAAWPRSVSAKLLYLGLAIILPCLLSSECQWSLFLSRGSSPILCEVLNETYPFPHPLLE